VHSTPSRRPISSASAKVKRINAATATPPSRLDYAERTPLEGQRAPEGGHGRGRLRLLDCDPALRRRLDLRQLHRQDPVAVDGVDLPFHYRSRQTERAAEPALIPLLPQELFALLKLVEFPLPGEREQIAVEAHVEIIPSHAGDFQPDDIFLRVLGQ